jgi:hypothetical protein
MMMSMTSLATRTLRHHCFLPSMTMFEIFILLLSCVSFIAEPNTYPSSSLPNDVLLHRIMKIDGEHHKHMLSFSVCGQSQRRPRPMMIMYQIGICLVPKRLLLPTPPQNRQKMVLRGTIFLRKLFMLARHDYILQEA